MTKNNTITVALLAFIAGCMGGPAVESFVVRPLSAQQTAEGVQRWEYQCLDLPNARSRSAMYEGWHGTLNRMGAEGWELGTLNNLSACFKRPL